LEVTKLSSKGQVVLPKPLRDSRNWRPGTEFAIEAAKDGVLLRPLRPFPPTMLKDVVGCLPFRGRPKTVREMRQALATRVKERLGSGRY
jgi:AbrB family looped-hinge helix DNA binding protein